MISIKSPGAVRFGYYLIKPETEEVKNDAFIMPDADSANLVKGEIIESGEYFYSSGEVNDLDFSRGDVVIYRDSGNIKIKVNGDLCDLVPHENVYISDTEEVE